MIAIALLALACSLVACGIAIVQIARRRPLAPMLLVIGLPGLIGGAYHTWRLWP